MTSCVLKPIITKHIFQLISSIQNESNGQAEVVDYDELGSKYVFIRITPKGGLYAHASFIFQIIIPAEYPISCPFVTCMTPIFHPNFGCELYRQSVCVNAISDWQSNFTLIDILHGLIYLFYELNFDDPYSYEFVVSEDILEDCIRKSLAGEQVNNLAFPPNESWCKWRDEQAALVSAEATRGCEEERTQSSENAAEFEKIEENELTSIELFKNHLCPNTSTMQRVSNVVGENPFSCIYSSIKLEEIKIMWMSKPPAVCTYLAVENIHRYYNATEVSHIAFDVHYIMRDGDDLYGVQRGSCDTVEASNIIRGVHQCMKYFQRRNSDLAYAFSSQIINASVPIVKCLFYKTHWPTYTYPGCFVWEHSLNVRITDNWPRSSSYRFQNDMECIFRMALEHDKLTVILIDPLALSPMSPILNRLIRTLIGNEVAKECEIGMRSFEWVSTMQSIIPPKLMKEVNVCRFRGISLLALIAFVYNWIRFASRSELYQSCLGYSRPALTPFSVARRVTDPFATCGIAFFSLGCGQIPLLDGLPLYLTAEILRGMCGGLTRILAWYNSRIDYGMDKRSPRCPSWRSGVSKLYFPFTDTDEI